jgi:hypothetical protein
MRYKIRFEKFGAVFYDRDGGNMTLQQVSDRLNQGEQDRIDKEQLIEELERINKTNVELIEYQKMVLLNG